MESGRVLVILKSYLGDGVLVTPLLRALNVKPLAVYSTPVVHSLIRQPSFTFQPIESRRTDNLAGLIREAKRLRHGRFESAVIVNRSFRSALLARLARIPRRIGHATDARSALLTDPIPYGPTEPEVESYMRLGDALGLRDSSPTPRLWVSESERAEGRSTLGAARIGIQPGASYPAKTIPAQAVKDLARWAWSQGEAIALLGGSDEVEFARTFSAEGSTINLVGKMSLRQTMGVVSNLSVLVGGDTGLLHVGAGLNTPTVTAFSVTSPEKWGHNEPPHQWVQAPDRDMSQLQGSTLIQAVERALA